MSTVAEGLLADWRLTAERRPEMNGISWRRLIICRASEPERDGVCAWTRAMICARTGWTDALRQGFYHPSSMTRVLRRMGFSVP